jgi:mannose-6-phosphate isomerase-like protein (cupin superfamily)
MRVLVTAGIVVLCSSPGWTQQAPPPQSDMTKVTHVKAAEIPAIVGKLPTDRTGLQRIFTSGGYNIGIERRLQAPPAPAQSAFIHKYKDEVFYVLDGSATMTTGGKLVDAANVENDTSLSAKTIQGGTSQTMSKGDILIVPAGLPHWFSDIQGSITLMQVYLPKMPPLER